jgi:hypothetical protein
MKNKLRLPLLFLLVLTSTFLPDYCLSLMNKGSDLYFYLGLVLVIVQFVVMASAIAMIVSDVREFYKEKKESKSNPSNSNKNDE